MRLVVTGSKSLSLEYFAENPPPYATLSHRWREEEVTFQDINRADVTSMKGYPKLAKAREMASMLGFKYLWMDTVCIDKSSSAELTESINSMYKWYKLSGLCLAFLDDVEIMKNFTSSVWFRRGWTLQELIAPSEVLFFTSGWEMGGTKTSLAAEIEEETGIDESVLLTGAMDGIPVARKMFWVSRRESTRIEDQAYSLLGIFGITMPVIYGEGSNAFQRLQQEIMKTTGDQTIFAWGTLYPCNSDDRKYKFQDRGTSERHVGLFAPSPASFENSGTVELLPISELEENLGVADLEAETEITGLGTRIKLAMQPVDEDGQAYLAYLACHDPFASEPGLWAIELRKISDTQFARIWVYYDADLYHIPYAHIKELGPVEGDDYIYVTREPRKPWEGNNVLAIINIEAIMQFSKKYGYKLAGGGDLAVDMMDYFEKKDTEEWDSTSVSALEAGSDTCLLLLKKHEKQGILIHLSIDPGRHNRADKNFFSVKATTIGTPNDNIPYPEDSSEESVRELLRVWKEDEDWDRPVSPFGTLDLPNGVRLLLLTICDQEVSWDNLDGSNDCAYTLWAQDVKP